MICLYRNIHYLSYYKNKLEANYQKPSQEQESDAWLQIKGTLYEHKIGVSFF